MKLLKKIENNELVVGIIGLGYVGLPLLLRFNEENINVIGFDVDIQKTEKLNSGHSYIEHIDSKRIAEMRNLGKFTATTDFSKISDVDAIIICVPTPLNKYREPDLSYVTNTIDSFLPYLRSQQLISLESTTYPGTTDEEIVSRLEKTNLKVGEDIFVVYSPEREDPGNERYSTKTIPKVCGGITAGCLEVGVSLYSKIIDTVVPVSSCRAAEMTKLLENIHRAVNIGLVNEMKIVADRMGIDIFEVINAAGTKPFGFVPYFPGPGLGGHCIPIDPFYLTWKAREYGVHTRFIELAGEINSAMPDYVLSKIVKGLNAVGKSLNGSKVLVLGIAYKKNVDDMRESPSVEIMELLREAKADVAYSDPHVPVFPKMREHKFDLRSVELTPKNLEEYDCVVLATAHDKFDYEQIFEYSKMIVDTRGVYKIRHEKLIKA
ncbi:nucleotide sugar dehydrogenase [Bacteriovorax sp. Seq25_V]|uniref:nucleotide sugar dehydrogenase n=1 Tax=Bacteriovorax sp. Seq25_V TaxID=1201288 RepID=UPI000389E5BE|nr:nucleotide sugar dehydrogenase [Bacteriovorax sp. Seq25_V]EQC43420.1 nucleotide sugar dehydrogenase [Bacteriovorax sp. Seq25_V]